MYKRETTKRPASKNRDGFDASPDLNGKNDSGPDPEVHVADTLRGRKDTRVPDPDGETPGEAS